MNASAVVIKTKQTKHPRYIAIPLSAPSFRVTHKSSVDAVLPPDAFACWWRPCGVTWDAVPEQSRSWLLLKLRQTPTLLTHWTVTRIKASNTRVAEFITICKPRL